VKNLAEWLKKLEHNASEMYKDAAVYFEGNPELRDFMKHLSEDEVLHYHIMGSAADYYSAVDMPAEITVDDDTKQRIEGAFDKVRKLMAEGTLSEEEMLKSVVRAEYSEWNKIFLYVASSLKDSNYEISYGVSKFQQHMKHIESYLSSFNQYPDVLEEIRKIPSVWEQKILVVEDVAPLAEFLKALLMKEGEVEIAQNGREALAMIKKSFYNLVIADIKMPVMDGMELFRRVEADYPDLAGLFIFHATSPSPDISAFAKEHNIPLLIKPSTIGRILETVRRTLNRNH
jgi:CheY-like chemotaxis protein